MSKERFVVGSNEIGEIIVTDVETGNVYRYDDISKFFGLIRLLNEQQATIRRLQDLCGESDGENAKLRIENEKLRQSVEYWQKKYEEGTETFQIN